MLKEKRTPNSICWVCHNPIYVRPYRLKKGGTFTCGGACAKLVRSERMKGSGNHQYGLKGEKNASYKGDTRNSQGYILCRRPEHPFADVHGFVREHRLVIEAFASMFDEKYFVIIDGTKYLKPEIDVHHINEDREDNRIENLVPLTPKEHKQLHNRNYKIIRNNKGNIIKTMRKIKIKLFENGKLPVKATSGSNGYDCYARLDSSVIIPKGERELINLGFALQLPKNYYVDVRPRSGLAKRGIDIAIGLVDSDYRGEIKACVINNSGDDYTVSDGDRICQIVFSKDVREFSLNLVDKLDETNRGSNGFGSSGNK